MFKAHEVLKAKILKIESEKGILQQTGNTQRQKLVDNFRSAL